MTFLPVVDRELRIAARRGQTYWTRFFAALTTLALGTWIWGWLAADQAASDRGLILFRTVSGLAFAYTLLAGIGITADCLSEEKREGTLGLLFLTDLKGYDVVLGKLAATSLNALYRLFAVFPVLAIPLLLGALTFGEFGRMALVLTNTLFFSLSAGMIASALSRRERQAMAATFFLILVVAALPAFVGWVQAIRNKGPALNPAWLLSSLVYPAVLAFDIPYKTHQNLFWSSVATTQIFSWGFLVWASLLIPHAWQDRPAVGRSARWRERWRAWKFGHGPERSTLRRRMLEANPIFWLVGRDRLKQVAVLGLLSGLAVVWLWLYWKFGHGLLDPSFYVLTAYCAHTVIKLWLASEVCRPLAEDRRSGALELILSTPLSIDEIIEGHFLALKRQFGWAVALILAADFAMLLAGMNDHGFDTSRDWVVLCLALMIVFIVDLYTLAWVGLWLSLVSKKASRAVNGTVGRVLVLPWAIMVMSLSLLVTIQWQGPGMADGEMGLLIFAFAISILNSACCYSWATKNLWEQFRQVATQRFDSKATPQPVGPPAAAHPPVIPSILAR